MKQMIGMGALALAAVVMTLLVMAIPTYGRQAMGWVADGMLRVTTLAAEGVNRLLVWGGISPSLLQAGIAGAARDAQTVLREMKEIQDAHVGRVMDEETAAKFRSLAEEGKALQDAADREKQIKAFEIFSAEVPDPALPAGNGSGGKSEEADSEVVGYLRIGAAVTNSAGYKRFAEAGFPTGIPFELKRLPGLHEPVVPLTRRAREELLSGLDTKAIATVGADVIQPQRIAEVVRATEQDQLRLRDVLNVARTTSPSIEFVKLTSYTRAAAVTAPTVAKPEATMAVTTVTTSAKTIAVWMPVTEQQLRDIPQLQNMIDVELLYDLRKAEEEEVMYGDGTGQHLLGILDPSSGVVAARTVGGDTIIDKIRRAITDVRRSGYAPNAVAIDPLDWETVVLTKGDDLHYLYQVFPTAEGDLRIWGLRVVETVAVEANAGVATEERNIVVGDFMRGATLWDYQDAVVQVGWINDQFITNMRTLRAEERVAFAVKRAAAFRKIETQASAT